MRALVGRAAPGRSASASTRSAFMTRAMPSDRRRGMSALKRVIVRLADLGTQTSTVPGLERLDDRVGDVLGLERREPARLRRRPSRARC